MKEVVVIRTGLANLASVLAALERAGVNPRVTEEATSATEAAAVVLPGVGAFGAAMRHLSTKGLPGVLKERIDARRPTLAICLGLQLFGSSSEESPGVVGIRAVDQPIKRFPENVKIPQLGWNEVLPETGCRLIEPGYAYFANSYCLMDAPPGFASAKTVYGIKFVSALEDGPVLACQFHPELSGKWGQQLINRWCAAAFS